MTGVIRQFRVSGSDKIMQLHGKATVELEPYFRNRKIAWAIDGKSVYYWLSRAEICKVFPRLHSIFGPNNDDAKSLCTLVKGARSIHSRAADDVNTLNSMTGYADLPQRGKLMNRFVALCQTPYPWGEVIADQKTLQNRMDTVIGKINAEPSIPPDDEGVLDDVLNDKRNLRGIQYLAFLVWRKETLYVSGINSPVRSLSAEDKGKYETLFYNPRTLNYPELSKIAQNVMYESGIANY